MPKAGGVMAAGEDVSIREPSSSPLGKHTNKCDMPQTEGQGTNEANSSPHYSVTFKYVGVYYQSPYIATEGLRESSVWHI